MNRLWLRIASAFFLSILILLLLLWWALTSTIESFAREQVITQLEDTAQLISQQLQFQEIDEIHENVEIWLEDLNTESNVRMTFIDTDGDVIVDSMHNQASMENHLEREEIQVLLEDSRRSYTTERYSDTLEESMLYHALKTYDANGEIAGIIRTSMTLNSLEQMIAEFWRSAAFVTGGLLILFAIISMLIARGISRPINEIIKVTKELRNKNYSSRVNIDTSGEIKILGESVNDLAVSLFEQTREIEENERELESIISQINSGVMIVDKAGYIELINPSMTSILNLTKDDLIGKHFTSIKSFPTLIRLMHELYQDNRKIQEELHLSENFIYDAHLTPYYGKGWKRRGIIVVLHNITNIRRLEQIRSDFIANVSHELKTPVTSVKGFTETLLSNEVNDEKTRNYFLQIIYDESDRIDRLIHDLLQLSRIEKHDIPLNIKTVDVIQLIHSTAATLQNEIEKKGLTLQLPNLDEKEMFVELDVDRFSQVILNLIANAINYSKENGNIKVGVVFSKDEFVLAVTDDGIGIPKNTISRVFERFYRVDKARSRHSGGTGLGLSIVKHLVELHKGRIDVESVEGEGSTFTVIIPRKHHDVSS
ncbi:two-component system histidine kinase PnpS [Aliicoccus persicus]|uniref:Sensor protein kinase WalK n=1 Tax=Aliicoccus persicus TaxID=930138 RepID=A0A662Z2X1_9STAP|nr:ATP-binding protein [Aliicoccus persicus]SEV99697.1 histidine kinase [Aliicoccus persicus]